MNVISDSFVITVALWVFGAIGLAIAVAYFLRPRTRARYPGGAGRYLLALTVQLTGFLLPIPIVLLLLMGRPLPQGGDVIIAVAAGAAVVFALRALPVTGQLLKDLHRARVEAAMDRLGARSANNTEKSS